MRVLGSSLIVCAHLCGSAVHYEVIPDQSNLKILTPALSERKTMKIRLTNGLEAYIVSDPESNQSAAALAVEAGSWHEPEAYPGLAHFCEHMLFMGSQKYPNENDFSQKVSDAGGMNNAYTSTSETNYMFTASHGSFNEILDIFAQFFISPLFREDAVKRELLAVHQEYEKDILVDDFREWMILKETARSDHPISRFDIGTETTLSCIPLEVLKNWHRLHYSSDKMHLAIYTNQSLEEMAEVVAKSFSHIPVSHAPMLAHQPILSPQQKGHLIYIKPLQEIRKVTFTWEIPANAVKDLQARIPYFIAYALSYKGENSLFEKLKELNLAENLSANCDQMSKDSLFLHLTVNLTKEGVSHLDEVIALTFKTMNHLTEEGIPVHLFNEYRKMAELSYEWQSRPNEFNYVRNVAAKMIYEPLDTFPQKTLSLSAYKPYETKEVLKLCTPAETLICVVASPELTKQTLDHKEQWLGGEYTLLKLDEEKFSPKPTKQVASNLRPNPFIPTDLTLLTHTKEKEAFEPTLLVQDLHGKCYFMQDQFYLVPKGYIDIGIRSPAITADPKHIALLDLFTIHLNHKLSALLSSADRGGLSASFSQHDLKIHVSIEGYHEKMGLLLNHIFDQMKTLPVSKDNFDLYKDRLLKAYMNKEKSPAFFQAKDVFLSLLFNDSWTGSELIEAALPLTYEDFTAFQETLFDQAYLEMLAYGNLDSSYVQKLYNDVKTSLRSSIYPASSHIKKKVLDLGKAKGASTIRVTNPFAGDAALLSLSFGKMTPQKWALQRVLNQALSEAFWDTLRTKQQTGYLAKSMPVETHGVLSQLFLVHSTTHYSDELLARFDLFLEDFKREIRTRIPKDRFEKIGATLLEKLSKSPQNLELKGEELSFLAFSEDGNFLKRLKLIEAVQSLSYEEFIDLSSKFLDRKNVERVAILVSGGEEKAFSYEPTTLDVLRALQF